MTLGGNTGTTGVQVKRLRRAWVSALMMTSGLVSAGVAAPAFAQDARRSFDIPAQSLPDALTTFGQQSGLQVSAKAPLVEGRTSSQVKGSLPPLQALSQLLSGTGLSFRVVGSTVTLELAPQSSSEAIQLGPVRVEGEGSGTGTGYAAILTSDPNTSEGTGSYTAPRATTATRMNLTLRETPQSVSVITRQKLDDLNLTEMGSALQSTTGVTVQRYSTSGGVVTMRGFGVHRYLYDGMSIGPAITTSGISMQTIPLDTAVYDRIEVIRGATGLTSGLGAPSGAVNFVRKRPTSEFQGHVQVAGGSWDSYRPEVDVSGPVTSDGSVRARVVATYSDGKSFMENYHRKVLGLYGIVEADLTPDLMVSAGVTYSRLSTEGASEASPVPLFYADGRTANFPRYTNTGAKWTREKADPLTFFARAEYKLGSDWSAKAQYFHSRTSRDIEGLYIGGYPDQVTGIGASAFPYATDYSSRENGMELQVGGPFSLLGQDHQLLIGYTFDHISATQAWRFASNVASLGSFYDRGNFPKPVWNAASRFEYTSWREESAYGSAQIQLAKPLKLIAGARITNVTYDNVGVESYRYHHKITPYVGLIYNITPHVSAYASYTGIFQPQAYRDLQNQILDPLTGTNYEAGLKADFYEGRLNLSAAVFRIEQDNYAQFVSYVGGEARYRAVMGAKVNGFEVEASGEVLPGLNISAGFTHRGKGKDADGAPIRTTAPLDVLRFTTAWKLPGHLDRGTVGGNLSWQSRFYEEDVGPNGEDSQQSPYATLDLFTSWQFNKALKLQANINNIFDKTYYSSLNSGYGTYGAPRNFMLTARYSF